MAKPTNGTGHADSLSALQQLEEALRIERRQLQTKLASITARHGQTENAIAALLARSNTTFVGRVEEGAIAEDEPVTKDAE